MQLELRIYLFFLLIERSTAIITTTSIRRTQEAMRTMVIVLLSDFFVSSLTGSSSSGVVSGAGVGSSIVSEGYKSLNEGQKVTFDMESDPRDSRKLRAVNVCAA